MQKIKISQKEFDEIYDIEQTPEITEATEAETHGNPDKQDTTPDTVLTESEQEIDDLFMEDILHGDED